MTGPRFHETRMGRKFYEHDLPALIRQLERLAEVLERVAQKLPAPTQGPDRAGSGHSGDPGGSGGQGR